MRRSKPEPRAIQPDPKFSSELVARFVNKIMREGKKTKAYKIFYTALDIIARKTQQNPLDVFQAAVNNAMPLLEVRPRRVGGGPRCKYPWSPRRIGASRSLCGGSLIRPVNAPKKPWPNGLLTNSSPPLKTKALPSRNATKRIAWPKPTKPLPTSDSNFIRLCRSTRIYP